MARADETIFALSSGAGRAGVAVFRLSGPQSIEITHKICKPLKQMGHVYVRSMANPATNELIDKGVVFLFKAPSSFTGEDMAELQTHGSLAVIKAMTDVLIFLGARPADPGEFTERSFRNGKMDLTQVEALADLIEAETDKQRKGALGQLGGHLSKVGAEWRKKLIGALSPLEAAIDFPDEDDIPAEIEARAKPVLETLIEDLRGFLKGSENAQRLRKGVTIVLVGPPNSGKSTLLNWLAGSDIAIVSDLAGTTRDTIEARLDLAGIPVTLIDTAGLRTKTDDVIEIEGMRRTMAKAKEADLRIGLISADETTSLNLIKESLSSEDLIVWNKTDISDARKLTHEGIKISAKTGEGMDAFLALLEQKVTSLCGSGEEPALTRARHVYAVREAITSLERAIHMLQAGPEMVAEDVRRAIQSLGYLTGDVGVEDILGEIFSSFCIGK